MNRLGIDVDGVLADFSGAYQDLFVATTGRNTFDGPPRVWDFELAAGYTKVERRAVWEIIETSSDFWKNLPALDGAVLFLDALHKVARDLADVYFITTRCGSAKRQTERWLANHGYPSPTVLVHAQGHGTKGHLAMGLGLTAVLDDKPENLHDIHPTVRRVLKKTTWNTHAWESFHAIDDLMQFFEVLR